MLNLAAIYDESNGDTSTEKYTLENTLRFYGEAQRYYFINGSYEDDRFSGYDFQSNITAGLGKEWIFAPDDFIW